MIRKLDWQVKNEQTFISDTSIGCYNISVFGEGYQIYYSPISYFEINETEYLGEYEQIEDCQRICQSHFERRINYIIKEVTVSNPSLELLKKYFEETPKEEIVKEWNSIPDFGDNTNSLEFIADSAIASAIDYKNRFDLLCDAILNMTSNVSHGYCCDYSSCSLCGKEIKYEEWDLDKIPHEDDCVYLKVKEWKKEE